MDGISHSSYGANDSRQLSVKKKSQVNYEKSFSGGSEVKESACNDGDLGLIPGLGRSLGGGHGNLLQYSCLENPHGQRSLAATVHEVTKSQT